MGTETINIRPGVSVLSVLRHLNYTYWHAIAEFGDNAVQSFLTNREALAAADGAHRPLEVKVLVDQADGGMIIVRDTAAGIMLAGGSSGPSSCSGPTAPSPWTGGP